MWRRFRGTAAWWGRGFAKPVMGGVQGLEEEGGVLGRQLASNGVTAIVLPPADQVAIRVVLVGLF